MLNLQKMTFNKIRPFKTHLRLKYIIYALVNKKTLL